MNKVEITPEQIRAYSIHNGINLKEAEEQLKEQREYADIERHIPEYGYASQHFHSEEGTKMVSNLLSESKWDILNALDSYTSKVALVDLKNAQLRYVLLDFYMAYKDSQTVTPVDLVDIIVRHDLTVKEPKKCVIKEVVEWKYLDQIARGVLREPEFKHKEAYREIYSIYKEECIQALFGHYRVWCNRTGKRCATVREYVRENIVDILYMLNAGGNLDSLFEYAEQDGIKEIRFHDFLRRYDYYTVCKAADIFKRNTGLSMSKYDKIVKPGDISSARFVGEVFSLFDIDGSKIPEYSDSNYFMRSGFIMGYSGERWRTYSQGVYPVTTNKVDTIIKAAEILKDKQDVQKIKEWLEGYVDSTIYFMEILNKELEKTGEGPNVFEVVW